MALIVGRIMNHSVLDEQTAAIYLIKINVVKGVKNQATLFSVISILCACSYPSHLAITGQEAVKSTEVAHNLLQGLPNNQAYQGLHSPHHCRVTINKDQLETVLQLHQTKCVPHL